MPGLFFFVPKCLCPTVKDPWEKAQSFSGWLFALLCMHYVLSNYNLILKPPFNINPSTGA